MLDGRYHLEEVLGSGGRGMTFRARRILDGEVVAIKELSVRKLENFKGLELVEREARVLEGLRHPGIPRYLEDFVHDEGGQTSFYLVQEFVEGRTLAEEYGGRPASEQEVLQILGELTEILEFLQGRSLPIVHRDIKPQNVMRRASDRRLMLIDFGSVRDALHDQRGGGETITGTFGFMAPEQFLGRATTATDIYALGALAVSLLSGRPAQEMVAEGNVLDWERHVQVSPKMAALLSRMLARNEAMRIPTAAALRRELEHPRAVAEGMHASSPAHGQQAWPGRGPGPRPPQMGRPPVRAAQSGPNAAVIILIILGALALFSCIGGGVLIFLFMETEDSWHGDSWHGDSWHSDSRHLEPMLADEDGLFTDIDAYVAGCERGEVYPCQLLAFQIVRLFRAGEATDREYRALKIGCDEHRIADACGMLGVLYGKGDLPYHDPASRMFYLEQGCEQGYLFACTHLGFVLREHSEREADQRRGVELYQRACSGEEHTACYYLGLEHARGIFLPLDEPRARELYLLACENRHTPACRALGYSLVHDEQGKGDVPNGIYYLTYSCQLGEGAGCNDMGLLYYNGTGVIADDRRARDFFVDSCATGYLLGCNNVGTMQRDGKGGAMDLQGALFNFERACAAQVGDGCYNEGWMYFNGVGVSEDRERARRLWVKACDVDYSAACQALIEYFR